MSQALAVILVCVLLAAWLGGAIAAMVHVVTRVRAPAWVVVPMAVSMLVFPLMVAVYWVGIALIGARRKSRVPTAAVTTTSQDSGWPAPTASS
jgi:hypothetical protein